MASRDLLSVVECFGSVRVLCVGDVMLDRFVYGDVTRISPEAPIPVVSVREERSMLGGAGNVARNISSLGAALDFVTVIGGDAAGEEVARELNELENCTPRLVQDAARKTSLKIRYLSHQQQILRVDSETAAPLSPPRFGELLRRVQEALPACGIVLLSDYAKGVLSGGQALAVMEACSAAGKPVFVDPKGRDFTRYRGAALIKPNVAELREASGCALETEGEIESAARGLLDAAGIGAMLVTRGAAGMMLVRRDEPVFEVRGRAREVFDVSGAGDTAAANLAVAVAAGARLEDAVYLANVAAGIVVSKLGTATVTREQLIREIEGENAQSPDHKVLDCDLALDQIARWRRAGMRVATLAGRFDLPQRELLNLLGKKRAECDKLVLAVMGRDLAECEFLAALVWVDLVARCAAETAGLFEAGDT